MRRVMRTWSSCFAGSMLVLLSVSGCINPSHPSKPEPVGSSTIGASTGLRGIIVALLANYRLLAVRATDGKVVASEAVAPSPSQLTGAGHYLAVSLDDKLLYVLTSPLANSPSRVVVMDGATATVRASYPVPEPDSVFRSLALGPQTGLLYLFGNRGNSVIISVFDPRKGTVRTSWRAREAAGHNWYVYQGAVSPDERHLLVSYHGPDTTGIDVFTLTGSTLQRCQPAQPIVARVGNGCLSTHGGFAFYGEDILAATGGSDILQMDLQGVVQQTFDTRLDRNHLMEFVVDAHRQRLYAVGACAYVDGFSRVDLHATPPPPAELSQNNGVCGERLTFTADGTEVVTGKTHVTVPDPTLPGQLLFVDVNSGRVRRSVETPSELIDLLTFPGP
jgi:hypothetical protein